MFDLTKSYYKYFNDVLKIPHTTANERQLSNYLVAFATTNQFKYVQDIFGNVVIYKEAYFGQENRDKIILHTYIDMAYEKEEEVDHDCLTEPVRYEIVDGWIHGDGTSIGANACAGISYILSILESTTVAHPALECVFTVQEKTGLLGCMQLKKEYFEAHRMIYLGSGSEGVVVTSAAGGRVIELEKKFAFEKIEIPTYELSVYGLLGGNSGNHINLQRGNANKIAARVMWELAKRGVHFQLIEIEGGNKETTIPRECLITFASNDKIERIQEVIESIKCAILNELEATDPKVEICFVKTNVANKAMNVDDSKKVIQFVMALRNGLIARDVRINHLPLASINMGIFRLSETGVFIVFALRSSMDSWIEVMSDEIQCNCDAFGYIYESVYHFPGWAYQNGSTLRRLYKEIYHDTFKKDLQFEATHSGSECGVFCNLIPNIDIITCAPLIKNSHTPFECMDLDSFEITYDLLVKLLEKC